MLSPSSVVLEVPRTLAMLRRPHARGVDRPGETPPTPIVRLREGRSQPSGQDNEAADVNRVRGPLDSRPPPEAHGAQIGSLPPRTPRHPAPPGHAVPRLRARPRHRIQVRDQQISPSREAGRGADPPARPIARSQAAKAGAAWALSATNATNAPACWRSRITATMSLEDTSVTSARRATACAVSGAPAVSISRENAQPATGLGEGVAAGLRRDRTNHEPERPPVRFADTERADSLPVPLGDGLAEDVPASGGPRS